MQQVVNATFVLCILKSAIALELAAQIQAAQDCHKSKQPRTDLEQG